MFRFSAIFNVGILKLYKKMRKNSITLNISCSPAVIRFHAVTYLTILELYTLIGSTPNTILSPLRSGDFVREIYLQNEEPKPASFEQVGDGECLVIGKRSKLGRVINFSHLNYSLDVEIQIFTLDMMENVTFVPYDSILKNDADYVYDFQIPSFA